MATQITIYNASYFLSLDAAPFQVRWAGLTFAEPEQTRAYARPWGRGYAPPVGTSTGNRTANLVLKVTGTDMDDWITADRQLREVLREAQAYHDSAGLYGEPGYLSVQLDGATSAVEWDILGGVLQSGNLGDYQMQRPSVRGQYDIPLELELMPWARPQAMTRVTTAGLQNGVDSYTLAAPAGDRETPVRITLQTAVGDSFRRILLARRTVGAVANFASLWPLECDTGSHGSYTVDDIENSVLITITNAASASSTGGTVLNVQHSSGGTSTNAPLWKWTITDALRDAVGRHRVFLRATASNASSITLSYGGTIVDPGGTGEIVLAASNAASASIGNLGDIAIPHRAAPDGVALNDFQMAVRFSHSAVAFANQYDCAYLMPLDEQFADITLSAQASGSEQLVNDNLGLAPAIYVLDAFGLMQPEYPVVPTLDSRFTLIPGVDNLFLPLVCTNTLNLDITHFFILVFEYYPRFELLIS